MNIHSPLPCKWAILFSIVCLSSSMFIACTDEPQLPADVTACQPALEALDVCPDTHLTLTFSSVPEVGMSGMIRIFDDQTGEVVDSLDLSIPAGPTEPRQYGSECDYLKEPYDYRRAVMLTNRTCRPGTPSGGAEPTPPDYQLTIIGGFTDAFHFYPVIVHDTVLVIYPHNNVLDYGRQYRIEIDPDCILVEGKPWQGMRRWRFRTRQQAPKGRLLSVRQDGTGDFCTVQGALDHIPDFAQEDYYVTIAPGDYEELVYARNKSQLHLQGAGMDTTRVHYANCEVFNPHPLTLKTNERPGTFPSRRAAFMLDNCSDVTLQDMTIATDMRGQAEGLLLNGERMLLRAIHIIGSGDALQANGTLYMEDCELDGGGDTFLGRGAVFAYHCHLRNDGGPFTWIRNRREDGHGDVFVECDFSTYNGCAVDLGRCPDNHGQGYPDAEQVLIRCRVDSTIAEGWSAIGQPTAFFAEYGTLDLRTGQPLDTRHWHRWSHHLKASDPAVSDYQRPEFVLKGWTPVTNAGGK